MQDGRPSGELSIIQILFEHRGRKVQSRKGVRSGGPRVRLDTLSIPGGARPQDMSMTWSMGSIYDRAHEQLGTTDSLIFRTRHRMINAAKASRDSSTPPPGAENPDGYAQRSGQVVLPRNVDWWEATQELRKGFATHEGLKALSGGG